MFAWFHVRIVTELHLSYSHASRDYHSYEPVSQSLYQKAMILEFLLSAYECTQHGLIYSVLKLLSLPNIVIDDYYCY